MHSPIQCESDGPLLYQKLSTARQLFAEIFTASSSNLYFIAVIFRSLMPNKQWVEKGGGGEGTTGPSDEGYGFWDSPKFTTIANWIPENGRDYGLAGRWGRPKKTFVGTSSLSVPLCECPSPYNSPWYDYLSKQNRQPSAQREKETLGQKAVVSRFGWNCFVPCSFSQCRRSHFICLAVWFSQTINVFWNWGTVHLPHRGSWSQ